MPMDYCSVTIDFFHIKAFPVTSKEFNSVMKAVPNRLIHLMKSHLQFQEGLRIEPLLIINGIDVKDAKCNNKHILNIFYEKRRIVQRGKVFWNNLFGDISWKKAWLLPYRFCINNKFKEIHVKILHNIYVTNSYLSKFLDIENKCSFCNKCIRKFNRFISLLCTFK